MRASNRLWWIRATPMVGSRMPAPVMLYLKWLLLPTLHRITRGWAAPAITPTPRRRTTVPTTEQEQPR